MSALLDSAIVAAYIAGPIAVLALAAKLGDRYADRRYRETHKPEVIGHRWTDWREPVSDFFEGRRSRDERLAHALNRTCFANNESRDLAGSGPLTSKEPIHASENQ